MIGKRQTIAIGVFSAVVGLAVLLVITASPPTTTKARDALRAPNGHTRDDGTRALVEPTQNQIDERSGAVPLLGGPEAETSDPADTSLSDWGAPYLEKHRGKGVAELKAVFETLALQCRAMRTQIRNHHIESGRAIVLPVGQKPEPYQIPVPQNPDRPIQVTRLRKKGPDGQFLVYWVYIDPMEYPDLLDLSTEYAWVVREVKLMGDHVMRDANGDIRGGGGS